jgi:2'-5' RNA ligase
MSSLVIVAIPAEDDLVWDVSSEKVPHLTLLYLGEYESDDNVQRMADFVEHAIRDHGPFYLDVDYRGELGPDKADVLFFDNGWDSKWIKSIRGQLLQQNDIRTEYDEVMASGDGFPDWVPHLTLGYPTAPAKELPEDRKFYSVNFDRIAVWTGDYTGPEFRLKWPERDSEMAVAYSSDVGKQFVMSHTSVLDDSDVRAQIKAKIQDILEDVAGSDANDEDLNLFGDPLIITKLQSVLNDFYNQGVEKSVAYDALGEAFIQHYGVLGMRWGVRRAKADLASGGKVANLRKEGDKLHNEAKIAHPDKAAKLRAKGDEKHNEANKIEKKAKEYLKGPPRVAPKATSRVPYGDKKKTKIEAEGGQNHPAHADALHVARAQEKLKKSGPHALSNQELRDVANRIQLETQVKQLTGHKGMQWVKRHLTGQRDDLARTATRTAIRRGVKTAGVAALL